MRGNWHRPTTDAEVGQIAADIDRQGYGALVGYVSEAELEPIRAIARSMVRPYGGDFAVSEGTEVVAGTVLSELPHSATFKDLCRRLFELTTGDAAPQRIFYQTLRCLRGSTGKSRRHSYAFHYDGYMLTAILPVEIPQNGPHGDLLVIPNTRRIRRWYLLSLLENNLVKIAPVQLILSIIARKGILNAVTVRLRPGTIYFIWGYRSLHANGPCGRDALRATAIFQFGYLHQHNKFSIMFRRVMPCIGVRRPHWSGEGGRD